MTMRVMFTRRPRMSRMVKKVHDNVMTTLGYHKKVCVFPKNGKAADKL